MYNTFSTREAAGQGIQGITLLGARACCIGRLSRGIHAVRTRCPQHGEFARFVDDESTLALWEEYLALAQGVRAGEPGRPLARVADHLRRREHLGTIDAFLHMTPDDVVGGVSAAMIHGIPLLSLRRRFHGSKRPRRGNGVSRAAAALTAGTPGDEVQVEFWALRPPHRSRWMVRRQLHVPPTQKATWERRSVTTSARTCVDLARLGSVADGVAAADWFLSAGYTHGLEEGKRSSRRIELESALESCAGQNGISSARAALSLATGISESPAESLALYGFDLLGLDDIRQQVPIWDAEGDLVGRVDFLITAEDDVDVVVEVDGKTKYAEEVPASSSIGERGNSLFDEKRREDRLRRLGYRVVRVTWADLLDPVRLRRLLREAGVRC